MSEKIHSINVRLNEEAHNRVLVYCEITGQKKAELLRCATAYYIAQGMPICYKTAISSRGCEFDTDYIYYNNIYDKHDKTEKPQKPKPDEVQIFFKEFWVKIKMQVFPERVIKEMKNQWDALREWGGTPSQLAYLYDNYCAAEKSKGNKFSQPNSWVAGHGWLNAVKADVGIGDAADVDVDMTRGGES